jgi:hypothetical protein
MKYKIILWPANSLPVVREVDSENLTAVTSDLDKNKFGLFPIFVFAVDSGEFYRVLKDDDGYFLSDDADELIGPATELSEFKRITDPQTMETDG